MAGLSDWWPEYAVWGDLCENGVCSCPDCDRDCERGHDDLFFCPDCGIAF